MLLTKNKDHISESILFHVERNILLHENVFRIESDNYFKLINEARELHNEGKLDLSEDEIKLINTDIGKKVKTTLGDVYLDCPFVLDEAEYRGEKVELNKPKRTPNGPKKFAVYVKSKTGGVKKVTFGDPNLRVKNSNKKAAKSFRARHKCSQKTDRTTAGYWSCHVGRYAKQLGLSSSNSW